MKPIFYYFLSLCICVCISSCSCENQRSSQSVKNESKKSSIENPYDVAIAYANRNCSLDFLLEKGYSKIDGHHFKKATSSSMSHTYISSVMEFGMGKFSYNCLSLEAETEDAINEIKEMLLKSGFYEKTNKYGEIAYIKGGVNFEYNKTSKIFSILIDEVFYDYINLNPISVGTLKKEFENQFTFVHNYMDERIAVTGFLGGIENIAKNYHGDEEIECWVTLRASTDYLSDSMCFRCKPISAGALMHDIGSKITICGNFTDIRGGFIFLEEMTAY